MANTVQATDLATLMNSIQTVLTFAGASLPVPVLAQDINEWYGETDGTTKFRYSANSEIYFRPINDEPVVNFGAARRGHLYKLILEVIVCTKLVTDAAGSNMQWSRDAGRGHFIMRKVVNDYLQDNMLFTSYDPTLQTPTGPVLTVACVERVNPPGWVQKPIKGDPGWGLSRMLYSLPLVDLCTIPLASAPG